MGIYGGSDALPSASQILDGIYTVDTLPSPTANMDKYARVTDLFGTKRDLVLASRVGTFDFWQPVRQSFGATVPITADITFTPLKSPNIIKLTGSIGVGITRQYNLSIINGWPGAQIEITSGLTTMLGGLNILGTGLGSGVSLALGGYKKFFLDFSGGSLQWVQSF